MVVVKTTLRTTTPRCRQTNSKVNYCIQAYLIIITVSWRLRCSPLVPAITSSMATSMLARATAIVRTFALDPWYKFQSTDQFPEVVLPTKRAVLQRLLHKQNWHGKNAVATVSK